MEATDVAAVLLAGSAAGMINAMVGSGTLVTFPVLLALGLPPVAANVTNTLGLISGSLTGALGYRRELAGQGPRLLRLGLTAASGGVTGGLLLLCFDPETFEAVVPWLIGIACLLVVGQPWIARRVATAHDAPAHGGPPLLLGVFLTGVYGGYFGAAQGVILLGLMGVLLDEHIQRVNAVKNVLGALINAVAALLFVVVAPEQVHWGIAALLALGATAGGLLGARIGRRLSPALLRGVIVVVGVVAVVQLVLG